MVYHVQTEDKGVGTPLILSLVYVGGAILASKRTPYDDLLESNFDADILAERLQRQHKLICAAIRSGRIEELKKLQPRTSESYLDAIPSATTTANGGVTDPIIAPVTPAVVVARAQPPSVTPPAPPMQTSPPARPILQGDNILDLPSLDAQPTPVTVDEARPMVDIPATPLLRAPAALMVEADGALHLHLLDERELRAGEAVTLRIQISQGAPNERIGMPGVPLTVKVLGTDFRPLILTSKSGIDGVAQVQVWLPRFTKGRAAVLIRAAADGHTAELRRIIHQK